MHSLFLEIYRNFSGEFAFRETILIDGCIPFKNHIYIILLLLLRYSSIWKLHYNV